MRQKPYYPNIVTTGGYSINHANSNPATSVTRLGNPNVSYHVLNQIRAAVIKDDETVNYYLDPTDFTKKENGQASTLTGADGQVMIYKPGYWRKVVTDGDMLYIYWSINPLPDYTYSQPYWIGQQLGYIDGGGKLCSIHGVMPTVNKHRDEFRTAARLRGSNNWCVFPYEVWQFINDAFRIKYATLNSQATPPAGLGIGATNASSTDWNNFNAYNPVVACGLKLTLDDAQVPFSVANFVGGTGTLNSNAACFYGIEHVFGHLWQWVDGLNLNYNTVESVNYQDAYICLNPAQFADNTATNYTKLDGQMPATSGYISKTHAGLIPSSITGGGSATYYCDYYYAGSAGVGWRGAFAGGLLGSDAYAGLACSLFINAASVRISYLGSRLCLRVNN